MPSKMEDTVNNKRGEESESLRPEGKTTNYRVRGSRGFKNQRRYRGRARGSSSRTSEYNIKHEKNQTHRNAKARGESKGKKGKENDLSEPQEEAEEIRITSPESQPERASLPGDASSSGHQRTSKRINRTQRRATRKSDGSSKFTTNRTKKKGEAPSQSEKVDMGKDCGAIENVQPDTNKGTIPAQDEGKSEGETKTKPLTSPKTSKPWVEMMDDEVEHKMEAKNEESLEREHMQESPQRVSAASRAIAALQEQVGRLQRDNVSLKDITSKLEMALEQEKKCHDCTKSQLESAQQKVKVLDHVNSNFEGLRTRLENERETFRRDCFRAEEELRKLRTDLSKKSPGSGNILDRNIVKNLEADLEKKTTMLGVSQREVKALKADIEYHQAQHDYMKIRLENLEAENEELRKRTKNEYLQNGIISKEKRFYSSNKSKNSMHSFDDEEKEVESKVTINSPSMSIKTFEDFPLVISAMDTSRFEIMSTLEFTNDQYQSFEILNWQTEEGFLREVFSIFDAYGYEAANVLRDAKGFSSKSWKAIYEGLCALCKKPVLFFINCRSSQSRLPSSRQTLTSKQASTLRFFVSCLSAVHDSSTKPERLVIVLEGLGLDYLKGEDLSGTGAYKKVHKVFSFSSFKRKL